MKTFKTIRCYCVVFKIFNFKTNAMCCDVIAVSEIKKYERTFTATYGLFHNRILIYSMKHF